MVFDYGHLSLQRAYVGNLSLQRAYVYMLGKINTQIDNIPYAALKQFYTALRWV